MKLNEIENTTGNPSELQTMPVLFVGHGSPMNALEDNEFSRGWREVARTIPRPRAILCISAHWETRGTQVTGMEKPPTIHDFGGFPQELYAVEYPAPGSQWLANEATDLVKKAAIGLDEQWGLDHGCWSVLRRMYPDADVPVIQMSLDDTRPAQDHYELAKDLAPLRHKGVLILASGNMVHNLRRIVSRGNGPENFNEPFGLDWAIEANELFKKLINENRHTELAQYQRLGKAVELAVPTPEHFLPMLYALALKQENEAVSYFNDKPVAGSLTMTSLIIGQ